MDGNHDSTATVTVIVDSTSSLTAEHIGDLPIEVVPLQLTVGERNYRDGVDLTPEAFYRQIVDETVPAQTAAPSPASYDAAFQRAFASGRDVLCITTASKLSSTYSIATGRFATGAGVIPRAAQHRPRQRYGWRRRGARDPGGGAPGRRRRLAG